MSAKIVCLDIETAPSLGYVWGKYEQNVIEFTQDWFILSVAWKWLGGDTITVRGLCDYRGYKSSRNDDEALITDLWAVLDAADIVVAHNGDSFDIKKSNARFLTHGLPPPSTYKTVDTLKVAKKHFRFDSNKLNDLGQYLGIGQKAQHSGFSLWKGCINGDPVAWKQMKEYNVQDVHLLEQIYLRLRPWCSHPDVTLYGPGDSHGPGCPNCGSTHIHRRGTAVARTRRYQRLNCQDCGAWFQGDVMKD